MLVIDPNDLPNDDYNPENEMSGPFGLKSAPYHVHGDSNLVPRDVIPEEENERTQDSVMMRRITEEREDTKKGSSNQDIISENSPIKFKNFKDSGIGKEDEKEYDDDYEEDDDEPIQTKPFQNVEDSGEQIDQEKYLQMMNRPVERPTTRNPRMSRGASRGQKENDHNKDESMGEIHRDEKDPAAVKIQQEIKGKSGFELPDDSD
jgi:hypothetical protein